MRRKQRGREEGMVGGEESGGGVIRMEKSVGEGIGEAGGEVIRGGGGKRGRGAKGGGGEGGGVG